MELSHPLDDFSPKNPENPESKPSNFDEQRHKRITDRIKGTIFTTLSASNPSRPISQELKCHIERRLHEFFPRFNIPSHPVYSLMIRTAIRELNEEGGSIAESISGFIEKNYEGLPWGHATFLHHHLRKLCRTAEIVHKNDGRYMIAVDQDQVKEECHAEKKENGMINQCNGEREKQVVFREKNEASMQDTKATEQEIELLHPTLVQSVGFKMPSVEFYDEEEKQYQLMEMNEEPSLLREPQFEGSDKHALARVQQDLVIVEQSIPKELHVEVIRQQKNKDQVKAPCVELVKEKPEFQEPIMKNSHSSGGMELLKCDLRETMMFEEKKDDLEMEEKQQTRTRCTERASDVELIEGEKQLREHHIEGETEVLGLSCDNKEDLGKNMWVSLGDSSLPMLKRRQKQFSNLWQRQQRRSILEENKFIIVCGLQAQQRSEQKIYGQQNAPNSHPDKKQQHKSQDTTMSVLLPLDHHRRYRQQQQQLEFQCGEWPFIREGDGDHYRNLRFYVRCRRRA